MELHLLLAERLLGIRGEHDARSARGENRLLDARRVDSVTVDEDGSAGEVLARDPQRVGVVPLLRFVIEDQLELDAVFALERLLALVDAVRREAGHDDHLVEP